MFPAGILKNTANNRFHPIVFRPAPMPSGADSDSNAIRHRSKEHHTEGFNSIEEARAYIEEADQWYDSGFVWEWSGRDTPATTQWFPKQRVT